MINYFKPLLILLSFVFIQSEIKAQTNIMGGEISGTLTAAGSPYKIKGDIVVPEDSVLILGPGVTLDFDSNLYCKVLGSIQSLGTEANPNKITCSDSLAGWMGIYILADQNQDTNRILHTSVEYTGKSVISKYNNVDLPFNYKSEYLQPVAVYAAYTSPLILQNSDFNRNRRSIQLRGIDASINNCIFRNHDFYGSYKTFSVKVGVIDSCNINLANCKFVNNKEGRIDIVRVINQGIHVSNCEFKNSEYSLLAVDEGVNIKHCKFINCGFALGLYDFEGTVDSCEFIGVENRPIVTYRNCSKAIIKNCLFKDSPDKKTCIEFKEGTSPLIYQCEFNNVGGISSDRSFDHIRLVNNVFVNSDYQIYAPCDVTMVNCVMVNNWRGFDRTQESANRISSAMVLASGGDVNIYNSIFWNNSNYFSDHVNISILNSSNLNLYNTVLGGGISSINHAYDTNFVFTGTYQDCYETLPNFIDTSAHDFHMQNNCSAMPFGFNKGYAQPIGMYYKGQYYSDILAHLAQDLDGNARMWDDTVDIGPYEVQALAQRIDVEEEPQSSDLCEGEDANIVARANSIGLTSTWQRKPFGGNWQVFSNPTDTVSLSDLNVSDSGTLYSVLWKNGCNDQKMSQQAEVRVHSLPQIDLGDDLSIPKDSFVEFDLGSYSLINWSTGDTTSVLRLEGTDLDVGTHEVSVNVIDEFGCGGGDTILITVVRTASLNEVHPKFSIYPNPATGHINVEGIHFSHYTIYDLRGSVLLANKAVSSTINVSDLMPGIYLLELQDEHGKRVFARFLKE